jgi:hypothetical protein
LQQSRNIIEKNSLSCSETLDIAVVVVLLQSESVWHITYNLVSRSPAPPSFVITHLLSKPRLPCHVIITTTSSSSSSASCSPITLTPTAQAAAAMCRAVAAAVAGYSSSTLKVRLLALVVALHDVLNCEACMVCGGEVDGLLSTLQVAAAAAAAAAEGLRISLHHRWPPM